MAKAIKLYAALAVIAFVCYNMSLPILLCFALLAAFFLSEKWYVVYATLPQAFGWNTDVNTAMQVVAQESLN
jgi:hypothetical protein